MWACSFGERVWTLFQVSGNFFYLLCIQKALYSLDIQPHRQCAETAYKTRQPPLSVSPVSCQSALPVFLDPVPISSSTESSPVFPLGVTPRPVCSFLFVILRTACLVSILGAGLLGQSESRGRLGPYVTPSFFCIHALAFNVGDAQYLSSGNNSNPGIRLAGNSFPKHCTRQKLIREHNGKHTMST